MMRLGIRPQASILDGNYLVTEPKIANYLYYYYNKKLMNICHGQSNSIDA